MIYLDNNATTFMPQSAIDELMLWLNRGNPSAGYASALSCQDVLVNTREYLHKRMGTNERKYQIIFTSGASEANNLIIRSLVDAFRFKRQVIPHIITSAVEHKSVLNCLEDLAAFKLITYTALKPRNDGSVDPESIRSCIRKETCLITLMYVNNELGVINDVMKIGEICAERGVAFHSDCVQSFGKLCVQPDKLGMSAITVSFHKLNGPIGCGFLVVSRALLKNFGMRACISGAQQDGLRGGTENVALIASSLVGMQYALKDREQKNNSLYLLRSSLLDALRKRMDVITFPEYLKVRNKYSMNGSSKFMAGDMNRLREISIIVITNIGNSVPNTLMLSVVPKTYCSCNKKLKQLLERDGIIIAAGSACNTSAKSNHVLMALGADPHVRSGALRISLSDSTTEREINQFVDKFINAIITVSK